MPTSWTVSVHLPISLEPESPQLCPGLPRTAEAVHVPHPLHALPRQPAPGRCLTLFSSTSVSHDDFSLPQLPTLNLIVFVLEKKWAIGKVDKLS